MAVDIKPGFWRSGVTQPANTVPPAMDSQPTGLPPDRHMTQWRGVTVVKRGPMPAGWTTLILYSGLRLALDNVLFRIKRGG